jgi:HAD superfamily hydrolase (TIGR01509 family)
VSLRDEGPVVTFDYGQTIAELDTDFLASRVRERGGSVDPKRLDAASSAAWSVYNDAKRRGETGREAWSSFMAALLTLGGAVPGPVDDPEGTLSVERLVEFLWRAQPTRNLWRRPIEGMDALLRDLRDRGVRIGIVSNSEGHLVELLEEMRLTEYFAVVADSGKLGFEKPDRRIFDFAADALGADASELIHVGDAWVADVEGVLAIGGRAVWVTAEGAGEPLPERVVACRTAEELRSALRAWGVPA